MDHEYKIRIYDKNGITGLYYYDFISLDIKAVLNDSGYWKLKNKTKEECYIPKGGGIIVYRDEIFVFSGILQKIVSEYDPISEEWIWEARGTGDMEHLKYRVIFPEENVTPVEAKARYLETYPQFKCMNFVHSLINYNLGINTSEYRGGKLNFAVANYSCKFEDDSDIPVDYKLRYDNLFSVVSELLQFSNGKIIPAWDKDNVLRFWIRDKKDISDKVRFYVNSDQIKKMYHIIQAPSCSRLITSSNLELGNSYSGNILAKLTREKFWEFWCEAPIRGGATEWGIREKAVELKKEDFAVKNQNYKYDFRYGNLQSVTLAEAEKVTELLDGYKIEITDHPSSPQYKMHYDLGDTIGVVFPDGTVQKTEITSIEISVSYGEERMTPESGIFVYGLNHTNKKDIEDIKKTINNTNKNEEYFVVRGIEE